jgi:hypothetical protein
MSTPKQMKAKWPDFYPKMKAVCSKCSEKTVYVYLRNTSRLRKLNHETEDIPKSSAWLFEDALFKKYDKLELSHRRLLSLAAVKSLQAYEKSSEKWNKRLAKASEEYDEKRSKRERTPSEKEKWIDKGYDALKKAAKQMKSEIKHDLTAKTKTLKNLWNIQKWVVLVLYSSHALRLDFADVVLSKPTDEKKNFLHKYRRKGWVLTLRDYKTAKFRGEQEIKMSRAASLVLSRFVPLVKALTTHGKLLTSQTGTALNRNGLSKLLTRLTQKLLGKRGFSASLIRVFKATKHRDQIEATRKLQDEMGHSAKQQFEYSRVK